MILKLLGLKKKKQTNQKTNFKTCLTPEFSNMNGVPITVAILLGRCWIQCINIYKVLNIGSIHIKINANPRPL